MDLREAQTLGVFHVWQSEHAHVGNGVSGRGVLVDLYERGAVGQHTQIHLCITRHILSVLLGLLNTCQRIKGGIVVTGDKNSSFLLVIEGQRTHERIHIMLYSKCRGLKRACWATKEKLFPFKTSLW